MWIILGESGIVSEDSSWGWQVARAGVVTKSFFIPRLVEILLPSPWIVNSSGPQCPVRHGIYTRGRGIDWTRVNMMQQCASLCQQRRACHYWTYIKSGQYTGYCATMTNVTRRRRWDDAVSGTKNCNWFLNDNTTTNYEIDVISKRENR